MPPNDDEIDAVQNTPGDLSREEIREEISGLSPGEQAELVPATVELAEQRHETPTAHYLMAEPLVPSFGRTASKSVALRYQLVTPQ
jgi:hypothetical protein